MAPLLNAALLLSALSGTFAAPLTTHIGLTSSKSYSIPAIHNSHHSRNGTADMLRAYAKYNLKPSHPDSILHRRQDGSVEASPDADDVEYLCPVDVGGQTLNLDFDTGSADLWVFSSSLPAASRKGHDIYTSSKSSTFQKLSGYTWDISYADGSGASGTVGTDTVTIGQTVVEGQAVELATKVSATFVSDTSDGLVGLAFSSINTVQPEQQKTFFDNAQDSLDSPLFAAYLPYKADGSYDFGQIDDSKYTGSIAYADVDSSNGFWEFPSTSYKVGSKTYSASGRTGIADTGTTLILMSDAQVAKYYAQVSGAVNDQSLGGYTYACGTTLPTLSFRIGTSTYATIPAKLMDFGPADSTGETCFGSLQSVGSGTQNIYGDVFFNAYYGIFDAEGPQFGFAASA